MKSEARVQSEVRLAAAAKTNPPTRLFRNNVGAMQDKTGRVVRFGIANESKQQNEVLKSADDLGWEVITITPDMVGQKIARVLSVEVKEEGWQPDYNDEHENAQRRWADLVNREGGRAIFVTDASQL